jgi:hypothetical protein
VLSTPSRAAPTLAEANLSSVRRTVHPVTASTFSPPTVAAGGRPYFGLAAVRAAWCPMTAAPGKWNPALPAAGQCAVTALLIQDLLGGSLVRGMVAGESHYWNSVDGVDIDLTREQFTKFALDAEPEPRDRLYVLSFPDTAARYRLLRRRVLGTLTR